MTVESIPCPDCGVLSSSVSHYKTRFLKHYALNKMETKIYQSLRYRCRNVSCVRKSFVYYPPQEGLAELRPGSRYTQSSKFFVANKMLQHQVSYNALAAQLQEDFGSKTAVSTLHTWTQKVELMDIDKDITTMRVLHTDEKHPSKKSQK